MRHIDEKERASLIKQIKAILKKEHIGNLSQAIITRKLGNKICQVTVATLLRGINPNFEQEKDEAINREIRKVIQGNKAALCTTAFVTRQLPFKLTNPTVLLYALRLGYDLKTYSEDAITTVVVRILNKYDNCPRQQISAYSKTKQFDSYISPPTVRKHLIKIQESPKWMKMLKNPNHSALKGMKRKAA